MRSSHAGDADPGSAAAVERPLPRDGDERGRRLQPLEGHRGDPLAGRPHPRQLGHVLYLRDVTSGTFWSTAHQPTLQTARSKLRGDLLESRAEFRRRDHDIDTHTEIAVSPEDDIELRRITHHQPGSDPQDDRGHELRRGRPRPGAPTPCTRRSATCSSRPRSPQAARPSSARVAPAPSTSRRPGCFT